MLVKEMNNKYPFISGIMPQWYQVLFPNSTDKNVENISNLKYGNIIMNDDYVEMYEMFYNSFIVNVDETMTRLFDVYKERFKPYDNVFEHTEINAINGEQNNNTTNNSTTTNNETINNTETIGGNTTTNEYGANTTSIEYGITSNTTSEYKVPQNQSVSQLVGDMTTTSNQHTDTTTNGSKTDSTTVGNRTNTTNSTSDNSTNNTSTINTIISEYTNTTTTDRHGNIGVTSSVSLGNEAIDFAHKMKLIEMFINEWCNHFTTGKWDTSNEIKWGW